MLLDPSSSFGRIWQCISQIPVVIPAASILNLPCPLTYRHTFAQKLSAVSENLSQNSKKAVSDVVHLHWLSVGLRLLCVMKIANKKLFCVTSR